jgi:hypothetical protein
MAEETTDGNAESKPSKIEEVEKAIVKHVVPEEINEEFSPTIGKLAAAMAAVQGNLENGKKMKEGYGYKYMELGVLTDIIRPHLAKNGISIIQTHQLSRTGNLSVITRTTIMHSSGEWIKSSIDIPITIMKQLTQAQMIGIACTYGRRYALQALTMVAAEDDTDAAS